MTVAHIIGNGPSKIHFQNAPKGHVYGCNFASDDLELRGVFIHDSRVFEHIIKHQMKLKWPVVNKDMQLRKFANCGGLITILDTYYPAPNESTCSSGHLGLLWLISKGYREIHIWGFDSLTEGKIDSDSKGKIDGSAPNPAMLPRWKTRFDEIFTYCRSNCIKVFIHYDKEKAITA